MDESISMAANTWPHFFSGRFRGNARYQRSYSALFSGYSLPKHIGAVF